MMIRSTPLVLSLLALGGLAAAAPAPKPTPEQLFTKQVRPILVRRCLSCHSGTTPAGELDLSRRSSVFGRGVVVPGKSAKSELVQRVAAGTMPPKGGMTPAEVQVLRTWVDAGVPWPGGVIDLRASSTPERAGRDWWSLQPLRPVTPPVVKGPAVTLDSYPAESRAIDAFVAKPLRAVGLDFSAEAPRPALIRRLTYDLHGLPPTPEEVAAFVTDREPGAYARLVDRLLASPRYGERMARRWLDAVRFAESDGYEHDMPRFNAWHYRDWVIAAFNDDLPYDRFIREQLAGDALHPDDPKAEIPTGFLVAGCYDFVGAGQAAENFKAEVRQDELEDMIGTTAQVFLGMTAQCARCHDHKFDPIPQRDYYRFQAALTGARHYGAEGPKAKHDTYSVRSEAPGVVRLLQRGQVTSPGEPVTPGGLSAIEEFSSDFPTDKDTDRGRRLALANWLTDARNPLTPRVMANRTWSWLMGQGIVNTPNDFGFNGDRPSHPELLDYLASRFSLTPNTQHPTPTTQWSLKALVRSIILSRAYRQSSATNPKALPKDASNRLLWRHLPRRLEAEEVRDGMLLTSGKLNLAMGGPGYQLFTWKSNAGALYEPVDPDGDAYCRRGIYRMVVRGAEDPLLVGLDCPDPSATTPRRQATTTATQALSLLNNSFVERQSRYFAERVRHEAGGDAEAQVRASHRLALGREPSAADLSRIRMFVERRGLPAWCRVLFNTSEFLYVE